MVNLLKHDKLSVGRELDGESEYADEEDMMNHSITVLDANRSAIDTTMMALWEMCQQQGLFRYDVTECETKTLPGPYGFQSQLNEGRANKKRPTEFRVDQVVQDFDAAKFNFTKAFMQEVLFQFSTDALEGTEVDEDACAGRSPDLVIINVSPIEYGHVLLVPRVLDRITQIVDPSTMVLRFSSSQPLAIRTSALATIRWVHLQPSITCISRATISWHPIQLNELAPRR